MEGSSSPPAIAHLLLGEGSSSSQAVAHLLCSEGSNSFPVIAHLPPKEGSSLSPAGSQLGALLPSMEGSSSPPAMAHLPPEEGSSSSQATAHLPQGKVTVLPRQVILTIKLGQSGKALGILPGIGHPRLPRRIVLSPGKTPPLPPPEGFPKGLLMKNLTLSGS